MIGGNIMAYLYKYFHKGPDKIRQAVVHDAGDNPVDEIMEYFTGRWTSSMEAAHRVLGYEVQRRDPAVSALGWHLPGCDNVPYRDGDDPHEAASAAISDLQRYFWRPRGSRFDNLLFVDYFEKYTVGKDRPLKAVPGVSLWRDRADEEHNERWVWERQTEHICRMYNAAPSQHDHFYLRMLLKKRPARSFDDLKIVPGKNGGLPYDTFFDTANAMGLLVDENEHLEYFAELCGLRYPPHRLRRFFVLMLLQGMVPTQVLRLYGKELLLDYYQQQGNHLQEQVAAKSLPNRRQIAAKSLPDDFRPATCIPLCNGDLQCVSLCKHFAHVICSVFPFAKFSREGFTRSFPLLNRCQIAAKWISAGSLQVTAAREPGHGSG
jgi:hypothetical protein